MEVVLDDIVISVASQTERNLFIELALNHCQEVSLYNISRDEYDKQLGDDMTLYCLWAKRGDTILALANTHGPKLFCVGFVPGASDAEVVRIYDLLAQHVHEEGHPIVELRAFPEQVPRAREVRFEIEFSREVLRFNPSVLHIAEDDPIAPSKHVKLASPLFLSWHDLSIQLYQPDKDFARTLELFKACFAGTVDEDYGVVEFPNTLLAIVDIPGFRCASRDFISFSFARPSLSALVVEGEEPIACLLTYDAGDVYFVELIGVLPKFRGKQIGKKLISWLITNLIDLGALPAKPLKLAVTADNASALHLYKSMGFELVNTIHHMRRQVRSSKKIKK